MMTSLHRIATRPWMELSPTLLIWALFQAFVEFCPRREGSVEKA